MCFVRTYLQVSDKLIQKKWFEKLCLKNLAFMYKSIFHLMSGTSFSTTHPLDSRYEKCTHPVTWTHLPLGNTWNIPEGTCSSGSCINWIFWKIPRKKKNKISFFPPCYFQRYCEIDRCKGLNRRKKKELCKLLQYA